MRELTSMQAACWSGRTAHAALGKVSAHLYTEFDSPAVNLDRLRAALADICRMHPMLRLRLSEQGQQHIADLDEAPALDVEDLRALAPAQLEQRLQAKRQRWSNQQLDLRQGNPLRLSISLLGDDRCRFHVDTDMIAIDPSSFLVLMEDLALRYENPQQPLPQPPGFFEWWDRARGDADYKAAHDRDRAWWRDRLGNIAPAPSLPLLAAPLAQPHSERLTTWLHPQQLHALTQVARERRLTLTQLLLGLFASVLAAHTGDRAFRLNVPSFWRPPLLDGVEQIVGEFANVLILDVQTPSTLQPAALCAEIAQRLVEAQAHGGYSGVNVMRDLSRHHGAAQLAPVVFTAALDRPEGELLSPRVKRVFGPMNWVMSQGPQVALDAQVACVDNGLLINWDVRLDALPLAWITELFEGFVALLSEVAECSEALDRPVPWQVTTAPLNTLQQAYLLGRSAQMPLGGVAMQEFREYRGTMEIPLLRRRLEALVRRHPGLRTRIDAQSRTQTTYRTTPLNLDEVDLRHLPVEQAMAEIDARRDDYAHALFDLDQAPWNITVFNLAEGQVVVFARFDALILDGRSIAALLLELLDDVSLPDPCQTADAPSAASPADAQQQRSADAAYWTAKLAEVGNAPQLPWQKPLEQIACSRYTRQSLEIPRQAYVGLCKRGAREGLFKNSVLMAVVLEVLSRWLSEGELCVAVPVAPLNEAALANRSTFIALNWASTDTPLAKRATRLQADVLEGLQHLAFSGVDLARLLFERCGPGPVLPVVITNGLSWPTASAQSAMGLHGGLTQTPQVALDIRFSAATEGALRFDIDYAREALGADMISDLLEALGRAVRQIAEADTFSLDTTVLLDTRHYCLNSPPDQACADDFLGRIAHNLFSRTDSKTALIQGERQLSYRQLGDGVARIIAALRSRGLGQGKVVAICLPRSPEHTQVTLACALIGVVWVPIDAAAPEERRRYLLDNCQPDLVVLRDGEAFGHASVSSSALLTTPAAAPHDLAQHSSSEAPAYYLYTSGTTGQPKCVVINNRATANVIGSTLAHWAVTERDVFLSVTPLHHDMSVFDVFASLSAGATLVQPGPEEDKDALCWNRLIEQHQVSLWCSVPAMLEMLLARRTHTSLRSLRLLAQGGDYLKPSVLDQLREWLPAARLVSLGGPTETTIWSIWHEIGPQDNAAVPYGQPLPGNRYFVLDEQGRHCPAGVVGRIHTAGVNLALGYLQAGECVQTDFITVNDEQGLPVRAFRTGDRGRYRADGTLLFDSRVNGYVKVRGVRVSLPDVEMALSKHPALTQVLVVDLGDPRHGEVSLGALYVSDPAGAPISTAQLRNYAHEHLAQSHVPTRFLSVAQLPLTANGKVDRQRARVLLSAPVSTQPPAPSTACKEVLDIYLEVLGKPVDSVAGPTPDFIGLGLRPQHLKVISTQLQARFSVSLSPGQLLRCRTPADVEHLLKSAGA